MVKVTVLHQGRRIKKKRTENVRLSTCPSWNEAIALPLPVSQLADISITVDVCKDRLSGSEVFMYLYYLCIYIIYYDYCFTYTIHVYNIVYGVCACIV